MAIGVVIVTEIVMVMVIDHLVVLIRLSGSNLEMDKISNQHSPSKGIL